MRNKFEPGEDESQFKDATDLYASLKEVAAKIHKLEKSWGEDNIRILLAYKCTFGGRVRGLETKIKYVDEVLETLKHMEKQNDSK